MGNSPRGLVYEVWTNVVKLVLHVDVIVAASYAGEIGNHVVNNIEGFGMMVLGILIRLDILRMMSFLSIMMTLQ